MVLLRVSLWAALLSTAVSIPFPASISISSVVSSAAPMSTSTTTSNSTSISAHSTSSTTISISVSSTTKTTLCPVQTDSNGSPLPPNPGCLPSLGGGGYTPMSNNPNSPSGVIISIPNQTVSGATTPTLTSTHGTITPSFSSASSTTASCQTGPSGVCYSQMRPVSSGVIVTMPYQTISSTQTAMYPTKS